MWLLGETNRIREKRKRRQGQGKEGEGRVVPFQQLVVV